MADDQLTADDIFVDVVRPGVILADEQWRGVIAAACAAYGLDQTQVLSTPYGYVTMPRPPEGNADGTGKVPSGISVDVAIHPVFWLDHDARRQRKDEPDDLYAVRLFLELLARKMLNPENQEVMSPFAAQGIDDTHPDVEKDLETYIAGGSVDWLNRFVIPVTDGHDPTAITSGAEVLVKTHRRNYQTFKQQEHKRSEQALQASRDAITNADFREEAKPLIEAGSALLSGSNDSARAQVQRVTLDLMERIRKLDEFRATIELATERAEGGEGSLINVHSQLRIQDTQRREAIEQRLAKVIANPSETTLGDLWKGLSKHHRAVVERGRKFVDRLDKATAS